MTSQRKLGIIAGGGSIPKMLIEHCAAQGRDFFVLAIEGNADKALITDDIPHQWIRNRPGPAPVSNVSPKKKYKT